MAERREMDEVTSSLLLLLVADRDEAISEDGSVEDDGAPGAKAAADETRRATDTSLNVMVALFGEIGSSLPKNNVSAGLTRGRMVPPTTYEEGQTGDAALSVRPTATSYTQHATKL